ncbi:hypothetical protein A0H81_02940 [Grifola frondosa]|uniref:Uncharacterized protein n=1 Tax=Grifola frondosa TaxID=5627 RepID=A0A1C7MIW2_GRIFR|nr:hypothetical protein A0H81_02940 [Grifola frondosa]
MFAASLSHYCAWPDSAPSGLFFPLSPWYGTTIKRLNSPETSIMTEASGLQPHFRCGSRPALTVELHSQSDSAAHSALVV